MKTVIMIAAAAILVAPAMAQTAPQTPPADKAHAEKAHAAPDFATLDADKSGGLTLVELQAHDAKLTQAEVDKYDADKNKSISQAEFTKWTEAAHKEAPKG